MDDVFAQPRIAMKQRADGTVVLESTTPLQPYEPDLAAPFLRWAERQPDAPLAAEWQDGPGWRVLTYRIARERAEAVAESLLARGLGPERPLLVLSGNSLRHLVLTLAGYLAGIPVAPLSATYSLGGGQLDRLEKIIDLIRPGAVYAEDGERFGAALALARQWVPVRLTGAAAPGCEPLADLMRAGPTDRLAAARAAVSGDHLAKILFTSGSTGEPKAVPNTHRMLSAVQQMMRQAWPFLSRTRLVLVDWLPWSHTFGGNHNLNMVLATGGTLYLDDGGPTPQLFDRSLQRLQGLSPNVYFNVPAGFELLAQELERDATFAKGFFADMRLLLSAGAPLPEPLRRRVLAVAEQSAGHEVRFTSSWGLTETSSAATSAHLATDEPFAIGVPLPGISLKLAPVDGRLELRVTGPTVMPGYLNAAGGDEVFDDEGYHRTGDAGRLVDPADPNQGVAFDGRIAEDFKLTTGTWVRVAALRVALLAAAPDLAEVVITGPGRPYLGALAWLRPGVTDNSQVRAALAEALDRLGTGTGSSRRVDRLLLLDEPPTREAGEMSGKGTVNQQFVLRRRSDQVDRLYEEPIHDSVIVRRARR